MNEQLVMRVKNALNKKYYNMNDPWLNDCIEFYLEDHTNPPQQEIENFVIVQWLLCDLREINNEKGCLPRNLAQQKCTTLPGKYILQMNKMYDISQSKYKQLEKIRNVSSENVEATENENAKEDKYQAAWEPKSKRMLQLFLTDGIQEILAIEYKPIGKLKDSLYPGFKVLISGPVICRKGVLLLEEHNISEMDGEVDSLLIVNAVENVLARALNLEENPDPYNDNNKQDQNGLQATHVVTNQIEDDFDIDSEMLDQIDKQIQEQNPQVSNSATSHVRTEKRQNSQVEKSINYQQSTLTFDRTPSSTVTSRGNSNQKSSSTLAQNRSYAPSKQSSNFMDDGDSFLEMVDERALANLPTSKSSSIVAQNKRSSSKSSTVSSIVQNKIDDFPMDDEMYDPIENQSPFFSSTSKVLDKLPKAKTNTISSSKVSSDSRMLEKQDNFQKYEMEFNYDPSPPKSTKPGTKTKTPASHNTEFPDDDFDFTEIRMETDDFEDYFRDNQKSESRKAAKSSQTSKGSSSNLKNSQSKSSYTTENLRADLEADFNDEFDVMVNSKSSWQTNKHKTDDRNSKNKEKTTVDKTSQNSRTRSEDATSTTETTGVKRLASLSPSTSAPQKMRCVENTPKKNTIAEKKVTKVSSPSLLRDGAPKLYEYIRDALKLFKTQDKVHTVVRGKVVNIMKLTMVKESGENLFFLEGTITDKTADLPVVFSSKVLETIIGYSPQEFCRKRKQSKVDPSIKDQLRNDLSKAQESLRIMDAVMEIKMKKDSKAVIMKAKPLTREERKALDLRLKQEMKK